MTISGGLRARLVRESLYTHVKDSLTDLGWFDPGRYHKPVHIRNYAYKVDEEIPLNSIVMVDGPMRGEDGEMGSNFVNSKLSFFFDVYAESDAMALHLAMDIRDICEGRINGLVGAAFPCYDFSLATPVQFGSAVVVSTQVDKSVSIRYEFEEHLYMVLVEVEDYYGG